MKKKIKINLIISILISAAIFSGCVSAQKYNFSLNNTLSIFMLKNENSSFFCVPIQYLGDYHIGKFSFTAGRIIIGDYEILLNRDEVNVFVYLNEAADEDGNSADGFNLVYLEERGQVLLSKMNEPLTKKTDTSDKMNHYYIFIERYLSNDEIEKITNEYERGSVYSRMSVEYDLVIDNEEQNGSGLLDDFELFNGIAIDPFWYPVNLNFFKVKYLQK